MNIDLNDYDRNSTGRPVTIGVQDNNSIFDRTETPAPVVSTNTPMYALVYIGSITELVSDINESRPNTDGPVYWLCNADITPVNAIDGDIIWNADT